MKYIAFIIWLLLSLLMCLLIFPALIADMVGWFDLGREILKS